MTKRGPKPHPDILTPRQWEVLSLLREGLKDQEIADRLDLSLDGAKYHVSEILSKLGVATRAEAAAWEAGERRPVVMRAIAGALGLAAVIVLVGVALLAVGVLSGGDSDDAGTDGPPETIDVFRMEGANMEPTFMNGDVLDVLRYEAPVENGDVIVFAGPTFPNRDFLKRVVASPGQTVEIRDGSVRVDGELLDEAYVQGTTGCFNNTCTFDVPPNDEPTVPDPSAPPILIEPPNFDNSVCQTIACYFVMGDNRQNSSDSRQGWLVPVENIIGYVLKP